MQAKGIWPLVKESVSEFFEDKAQTLAAALAIYTMLSIAPLLVIVTKLLGIFYRNNPDKKVISTLQGLIPGMTPEQLQAMLKSAATPGQGVAATTISTIIIIFGATGVFGQLQDSMNTIWEVKPKPNLGVWGWIRARFLSFAMVLGIAFLFMVSTLGSTVVTTLAGWIAGPENKVMAAISAHLVSLVVMWVLFLLIFKVLPDAKTGWKDCAIGAAVTAVLFELGKIGLDFYINGSATKVFGAASALAALLLFIFYSAQIMFLGAEFTQVYAKYYGVGVQPDEHAVKVTEEDKAEQGRPTQQRLEQKTAEKEGRRPAGQPATVGAGAGAGTSGGTGGRRPTFMYPPRPAVVTGADTSHAVTPKDYILAAGGIAAGALGAWYWATQSTNRPHPRQAAAVHLDERIKRIEDRIGRVSRLKEMIGDVRVYERIKDVEKQLRHARTAVRAKDHERPGWAVRLGDLIAGNK